MRTSTAYFAGVGTVIVAIGAGLGGGYMAANIAHPPVQTVSKLERRMSADPIQVTTAPAEPASPAAAPAATGAPAAPAPPQEQSQSQPQQIQAAAPVANTAPVEEKISNTATAQPASTPPQPAKSDADERTATPRDSYARASDADLKRAAAEKRRAERRQQSADKRRWKRDQQPRDQQQELDVVENSVREATEPRRIRIREEVEPRGFFGEPGRRDVFAEPARGEGPRIRLFDQDD